MLCRCTRTWIFFDDVSGHKLDHAMAKKTRTSEIWVSPAKVPRAEAIANGCKVMSTRWMDVNKGDDKAPNYRSRFVGREIKKGQATRLVCCDTTWRHIIHTSS